MCQCMSCAHQRRSRPIAGPTTAFLTDHGRKQLIQQFVLLAPYEQALNTKHRPVTHNFIEISSSFLELLITRQRVSSVSSLIDFQWGTQHPKRTPSIPPALQMTAMPPAPPLLRRLPPLQKAVSSLVNHQLVIPLMTTKAPTAVAMTKIPTETFENGWNTSPR